jgi:trehalose/maltose transport system substrate-binding protein
VGGATKFVTQDRGVARARSIAASARRRALGIFLLTVVLGGCQQSRPELVTLNYFRLGWLSQPDELSTAAPLLQRFTQETGIHLKNLPVPESTLDQLDLSRNLLRDGGAGPDVLGIDLIWSGVLAADLIDLRAHLAAEISSLEPQLMTSYTVSGRVVAIPYGVQVGVLEYRADLLREYRYDHPPRTWDELESMAERIQAGERAKGKKDFWGYVWQGVAAEALTCNALEWQAAEGGGQIIEKDRTISVNNPAAIRAWQRAKRWIGWISPPSVVAYRELDSMNVLDSGGAAFGRVWGGTTITPGEQFRLHHLRSSLKVGRTGYASMPGGPGGSAGTLGGSGVAVSGHSLHVHEAIELVHFLIREEIHSSEQDASASAKSSPQPAVYDLRSISGPQNHSEKSSHRNNGVVTRPSGVAGDKYDQVTRAYIGAVHAVLTGQKGAPEAAGELEKQLIKITGFRPGPPKTVD